jgi:hypothetical protein
MASHLLASDLNNPDYQGASNPDSRLAVQFYSRPVQNEFESEKQGRPIFTDVDFVRIFVPGDQTSAIDTFAREEHKKRFPMHWAHYQNKHGGDPKEIGTPLSQWPRLTQSQVEELRALKFFTVESVANAADVSLQNIGMVAGMSPFAFRDHAKRFLQVARGDAVAQEAESRAKALDEENKRLREAQEAQAATLAAMQEQLAALARPKRKYTKKTEGVVK